MMRIAVSMLALLSIAGYGRANAASHPWTNPQRLVYGDQVEPDSLNPYISNSLAARRVQSLIFSGLLRYGRHGAIEPDLATVVPSRANGGISADGKTIVYHLRANATWHDGVPVTAADVIFTWHAVLDPAHVVTTRVGFDEVARMDAPDPHTLRMIFRRAYAPALALFCVGIGPAAVLPQHVLANESFNTGAFGGAPVGSGPYVFRRWDRGSSIALGAYPAYYLGAPHIAAIEYRIVPDTTSLFNAIRTHAIDAGEIEANFVSQAKASDGIGVAVAPTLGYRHVEYNTTHGALRDPNVRLALSYAIDRDAIFRKIYFGYGETSPGNVLPSFGWGDPSLKPYSHDLGRAQRMLDRAGWRMGPDGVRTKDGARLEFTLAAIAGQRPAEITEVELQSDWARAGVAVTIKNAPGVFLFSNDGPLVKGDFDIAYFGWTNDADPDDTNRFASSRIPPAGRNFSRLSDPLVDRLAGAALTTPDVALRHRLVARIDDEVVARDPIDTIYWIPSIVAHNVDLLGLEPTPGATVFWNVKDWQFSR